MSADKHIPKPKGILKNPTTTTTTTTTPPITTPPPPLTRAQQAAQQEARARLLLLQKLRDTELKPPVPLETFELLCQFPRPPPSSPSSSPPPPASSPSPSDVAEFLSLLSAFQPSEYLDLIEERNCLGKCGYTLCARPRRTYPGQYKVTSAGTAGVARTADLNKWCSDECALRALYLKVQLDNPSYERRDGKLVVKLELRKEEDKGQGKGKEKDKADEKKPDVADVSPKSGTKTPAGSEQDRNDLAQAMAQLELDKTKRQASKKDTSTAALAAERGDASWFAGGRVEVTIREKSTSETAAQPPNPEDGGHMVVEGYETTFGTDKKPGKRGDGDDDDHDDDDPFPKIRYEAVKFE
ncbi:hypothetical protein VTK26DRAFT_857 [Humicola hyalothermophila]